MILTDTEKMIMSQQIMARLGTQQSAVLKVNFITVSIFMSFKEANREKKY